MKIIISPDVLNNMLGISDEDEAPSIHDILSNKYIKNMIKDNLKVTSIYQDEIDTTNLNNYVINVAPV